MSKFYKRASAEEDASYALMGFLVKLAEKAGSFVNSSGETIRISDHIYVVGGAVRNYVIGQPVKDVDVVIDSITTSTRRRKRDAAWFATLIENAASPVKFGREENNYGVVLLKVKSDWIVDGKNLKGEDIEIVTARSESYTSGGYKPTEVKPATIEEDAKRREFTFNTLLWSLGDLSDNGGPGEEIITDPLGVGLRDLKKNIIDTPLDPKQTFEDDASRMVRAMKFKFKYGFDIAPRVQEAIEKNPEFIRNVPHSQLYAILTTTVLNQERYKQALEEMKQSGLLSEIIRIANEEKAFGTSLLNWAKKEKDYVYLFELIDYGFPFKSFPSFLDESQRRVFRGNIMSMSKAEQEAYHDALKSVNQTINKVDRSFFMDSFKHVMGADAHKSMIGVFKEKYFQSAAVKILLDNPNLTWNPKSLKDQMETELNKVSEEKVEHIESEEKLASLISFLKKEGHFTEGFQVSKLFGLLDKRAETKDLDIPSLSGDVQIFDMDDTLFWAPEWHSLARYDESGSVVDMSRKHDSQAVKAFDIIGKINSNPIDFIRMDKEDYEREDLAKEFVEKIGQINLQRETVDIPWLGKKDQTLLVLTDAFGNSIKPEVLKKFFPSKHTKNFDMREKYLSGVVSISGDPSFYQQHQTLGDQPNDEIMDIYRDSQNSVILTARESFPGMEEGILKRIEAVGAPAPTKVFTKPLGESSGKYKGEVIGRIAEQENVNSIVFYDDNLSYIKSIEDVLDKNFPKVKDKVKIISVDTSKKPKDLGEGSYE